MIEYNMENQTTDELTEFTGSRRELDRTDQKLPYRVPGCKFSGRVCVV